MACQMLCAWKKNLRPWHNICGSSAWPVRCCVPEKKTCDPRFPIYRSFMLLYIHKIQVSLISEHKFLYIPEYSGTSTNVVPGSQVFFSGTQHLTGHADDWHFYVCNANIILCIRITLTNLSHRLLIRHLRRSARWPWRISYRIPSHISSRGRRRLNDNSPESLHKSVGFITPWYNSICGYIYSIIIGNTSFRA